MIEAGVRRLVDAGTRMWGLVTYDSCQGTSTPALTWRPPNAG